MKHSHLIDLSHTIQDGLVTYPRGHPVSLTAQLTREASKSHYADGTTFQIDRLDMTGPTGTYLDAPFHRHEHGPDLADLPLASTAGLSGMVVQASSEERALGPELFQGLDISGKAVLVRTGFSEYFGTDRYFQNPPFLTREAAEYLADNKAALVGVDFMNVDDTNDPTRPVHTILLGRNIPIVEHLTNLDQLPDKGFLFFAVPPKVKHMGSITVRAFALVE
jgi:kynurenine formamidase